MMHAEFSPDSPAIICRGLTKTFGNGADEVIALRGVDVQVEQGEFFLLVGPSGCGKTTLISVIAGTLEQTGGSCEVLGVEMMGLQGAKKTAFRAQHIGFVFQAFNLLPPLRAYENAAVPLIIQGTPRREANERAKEMLVRVGLENRMNAYPSQLSGGQQQRVAIARALVHNPALIVCDEPTSALDHDTGTKVMELLKQLSQEGNHTFVIVTHDARIFSYADRIARMDDGQVVEISGHPNAPKAEKDAFKNNAQQELSFL